jgi:bifunctional non-homologous end joining protein LigD
MAEAMLPGFIPPCLRTKAKEPPCGGAWVHEIKQDGFRIIARKDDDRVRLYSRSGRDFTHRFALIVEAAAALRSRSCILDGEPVACGDDGVPSFDHIRYRRHDGRVFLYAFDLIELNATTCAASRSGCARRRWHPCWRRPRKALRLNEHLDHDDGEVVLRHACKMGLEGSRGGTGLASGLSSRTLMR